MTKIEMIDQYIDKCEKCVENNDPNEAKIIENTILGIFTKDISGIRTGLDRFSARVVAPGSAVKYDYLGDVMLLKAKLEVYKAELEENEPIHNSPLISINNVNKNTNTNSVEIELNYDELIQIINSIPGDQLSNSEKEMLEDKINSVELQISKKDREKASAKLLGVLKFIADKSVDVGIALLPYMGKIAMAIQNL